MKYSNEDIERIRLLIADGESQKAIEALFVITQDDDRIEDDLVLLKNRLAHLHKSVLDGTIARDDENIERNTINRSLLALLKTLEDEPTPAKPEIHHTSKPDPVPATSLPSESDWLSRRSLFVTGGLLFLLLTAWAIGKWIVLPQEAPAPVRRNLTARLIMHPKSIQIPSGAEARLQVGEHLTTLEPIPKNGVILFEKVPVNNPADSAQLQLSGLKFPGKITRQSAPDFRDEDEISFYYEPELVELKGKVVNYVGNKPLAGIKIELENGLASAVTDKNGKYTLVVPKIKKQSVKVVFRRNGMIVDELTQSFNPEVFELLKIKLRS